MDLDDELRQLFTSEDGLDVPVRAGAEDVIVAGARRVRRRRIVAVTATGVTAVVAVVAVGIALASGNTDAMPPATTNPTVPPETSLSSSAGIQPGGVQPSSVPPASGTTAPTQTVPTTKKKTTTTTTVTSDPAPPDLGFQILGPTGFRALKLGQTLEEAQATGLLGGEAHDGEGSCAVYALSSSGVTGYVHVSDTVQAIAADPAQTAQGVGRGWTVRQAKTVYPDLDEEAATAGGWVVVSIPGNAAANYRLQFVDGEVTAISLAAAGQTCQ